MKFIVTGILSTALLTGCLSTKNLSKSPRQEEFNFDRAKATLAAADAMETFWKESTAGEAAKLENNPKNKLDMTKPQFIAKEVTDCDKAKKKMVTVVFPNKSGTGAGWARLFLDKSGVFLDGQNIGETTDSVEQTLIEQSSINCEEQEP